MLGELFPFRAKIIMLLNNHYFSKDSYLKNELSQWTTSSCWVPYFCCASCIESHVRWGPCPHSMARPRVADGGTASSYGV
jgi:hypothetical protein